MSEASIQFIRTDDFKAGLVAAEKAKRDGKSATDAESANDGPKPRRLDLSALASQAAPPRQWFIKDWLGPWPTLFAAGGGLGKSLAVQQISTALALRRGFIGDIERAYRSLCWFCEDDHDELWRRQEDICSHFGEPMDAAADRLIIESRVGVDSLLMTFYRGEPVLTGAYRLLRERVNDEKVDILWLDNVAHLFGGEEHVRNQVTAFVNSLAGLVTGRPFCVVVVAHIARAIGSEFAGSAAWENAVRMRWYLGDRLPGDSKDNDDPENDVRYLAKRKTNYSAKDYRRFTLQNGVLVPDEAGGGQSYYTDKRAEEVVLDGFARLCAIGVKPTDSKNAGDYLPRQLVEKQLAGGFTKKDLAGAMNRLMGRGALLRAQVDTYANRNPRYGLVRGDCTK